MFLQVAFDARTQTLLLLADSDTGGLWDLVSLKRVMNEWVVVQRLELARGLPEAELAVCNSCVLLVDCWKHILNSFDVSSEHSIRSVGSIEQQFNDVYSMACTQLDGDALVVFSHINVLQCLCAVTSWNHSDSNWP